MVSEIRPQRSSSCGAVAYTVDSFANGISFGQHRLEEGQDPRDYYGLSISDEGEIVRLRSRYALHHNNPTWELERYLMRLSQQGVLGSSTIYFGTSGDPFHPFDGKFEASMKFLQLFERYVPGLLVVQTRSPLVVLALPVLQKLGDHAAVTIALETDDNEAIRRYTPDIPLCEDRLKAATALRRFGIEVTLQVAPVLPYGDWKSDAQRFAHVLIDHADYLSVRPLHDGSAVSEQRMRHSQVAKRMAADRKFVWLRPDTARPLVAAIEKLSPAKLETPSRSHRRERQMSLFVA